MVHVLKNHIHLLGVRVPRGAPGGGLVIPHPLAPHLLSTPRAHHGVVHARRLLGQSAGDARVAAAEPGEQDEAQPREERQHLARPQGKDPPEDDDGGDGKGDDDPGGEGRGEGPVGPEDEVQLRPRPVHRAHLLQHHGEVSEASAGAPALLPAGEFEGALLAAGRVVEPAVVRDAGPEAAALEGLLPLWARRVLPAGLGVHLVRRRAGPVPPEPGLGVAPSYPEHRRRVAAVPLHRHGPHRSTLSSTKRGGDGP
mmetsp:Transcript_64598/g.145715  ORF Transcript_64598/g.145715 Transcript_64598/m.145715 type:complete len:254 (+) Transcript_64598:531-1292(+)